MRKLKEISQHLSVEWNRALALWVIWYQNPEDGRKYRIYEVKNEDDSYRPLDDRTIHLLRQSDTHRMDEDPIRRVDRMLEAAKMARSKAIHKIREEKKYRARQQASQWLKAAENFYYNGVFSPNQTQEKKIISIGSNPSVNQQLIQKLGAPHLPGAPKILS